MMGKKRCKRGQMAAFLIIGIVLLIGASIASYFVYLSRKAPMDQALMENLPETLDKLALDNLMTLCIKKAAKPDLISIAKYGGTLSPEPNDYGHYNHTRYRYLCEQKPGYTRCVNILLTRESMQEELQESVLDGVKSCVQPAIIFYEERGYEIEAGEPGIRVIIGTDDVNVIATYPIMASKNNAKISVSDYSVRFSYPLGKLYDLAMTIMNDENSGGYFNQEAWMYNHSSEILIQKHRPYPDIIYKISKYDPGSREAYIFNFAMNGYDALPELAGLGALSSEEQASTGMMAARSNAYDQDLGCCRSQKDGSCFENSDKNQCGDVNLEWRRGACSQAGFTCKPISEDKFLNESGLCSGRPCRDCMGSNYALGDDPDDSSSFTGQGRKHGESWCEYEGPTGMGNDFVGSRHYKHVCIDGNILVEECRDYRDEMCVEEQAEDGSGISMAQAVCRPNRWEDCHLYSSSQQDCEDTSKRDCYWAKTQDKFLFGKPSDTSAGPATPYEKRYCVPKVSPGLRFWNSFEGMQVCGWANNYYECNEPGCFQEWTDFDAAFCSAQADCGINRNYIGKLPTLSLSNLFSGGSSLPGLPADLSGMGFSSSPKMPSKELFEKVMPNEDAATDVFYRGYMKDAEAYPQEWAKPDITPDMFIHNSPNDYSLIGIMKFAQEFARWGLDRLNNAEGEIWNFIVNKEPISWATPGISTCGVWTPSTTGLDCGKCNGNPYRPCTEYRCRSLGMFCNYEEIEGVGKCSSYQTATIGKPIVKFDGQITGGYEIKSATLTGKNNVYVGKEITRSLSGDYTFQVETNRETQCKLVLVPSTNFGISSTFPGTVQEMTFSRKHNMTIPYMSSESLSVLVLPLEIFTMISFDPDRMWNRLESMTTDMIDYVDDIADECHDCNPYDATKCGDGRLVFLSDSDCDDMDDVKEQIEGRFNNIKDLWNSRVKEEVKQWLGAAEENAVDEILRYASTENKYHAFIKCRDRSGNENDADLDFIRFRVNPNPLPPAQEEPDGPPAITSIMPMNWTGPQDAENIDVYVFTDTLAECRYTQDSAKTSSIVYMDGSFDCPASIYEGGSVGGYLCKASMPYASLLDPSTPYHIRCADHMEHHETYGFRLDVGEYFDAPSKVLWMPGAEGEPGTVMIKDPRSINQSSMVIKVPATSVKLFVELTTDENDHEKAAECRYSTVQSQVSVSPNMLVDPSSGSQECSNCTALLTVGTGTDYYMSCRFKTTPRNEGGIVQYVLRPSSDGSS